MIGGAFSRISTAEKMSVDQLKEALQNKTIPAYIAVPLIEEKLNMNSRMQSMAAMQQARQEPPIAEQVMQRAAAESGINTLPSNLPVVRGAGGGIVAFADGGDAEEDDDDEDETSYGASAIDKENEALLMRLLASRKAAPPMGPGAFGSGLTIPQASAAQQARPDVGIDALPAGNVPAVSLTSAKEERSIGLKAPSGHKYEDKIVNKAEQMGIDPQFALYIAGKETGGLRNPETAKSRAGAMGIMQLMPGTAKDMGVKDPFDPEQNIEGGLRYAKMMMDKYKDPKIAAIAYNWGPGNTDKWLRAGADIDKLPRETRNYVASLKEGGVIRFQNTGLVEDDIGFGPGRFMPNYTMADVAGSANVPGLDASETDFKKRMEALGARLDAARLAVGKPPSSRDLVRDPTLSDKYKKSVEERNRIQKEYEKLMETEGGLGGPITMRPSAQLKKMVPVPSPVVQEAVKSAPPSSREAAAIPLAKAASDEQRALQDQFVAQDIQEGGIGRLETPASSALAAATQAADDAKGEGVKTPSFADKLEDLLSKREKSLGEQRQQDKYMALLAAGLGMMGGTSRNALQNIGQGAMQGVASLQAANRQRAAEENALLSGRLGQYRVGQTEALRTQLAGEAQQTKLTQQLSSARQNAIKNIIAAKKIDINAMDQSQLSRIESEADAMLSRDPAYQAIYKKLYGTGFASTPMAAAPVDYFKNYNLTPRKT